MAPAADQGPAAETAEHSSRHAEGHVWERSRRSVAWPLAIGVAGLAALGVGQGWPQRDAIETDLTERSSSALARSGVSDVTVSFEGRDGIVSGTVDTEADRDRVLSVVRSEAGVRVTVDRLTVRTPGPTPSGSPSATATTPPSSATPTGTPSATPTDTPSATPTDTPSATPTDTPSATPTGSGSGTPSPSPTTTTATGPAPGPGSAVPTLDLVIGTGSVTLSGAVPSAQVRDDLVAAASTLVGEGNVKDRLTIDPGVDPTGLAGLGAVLAALGSDAAATVALEDGTISLDGSVGSPEARQQALSAAEAVVGTAAKVKDGLAVRSDSDATDQRDAVRAAIAELPRIGFATGSATLTRSGRETVRQVSEILKVYPDVRVQVQGHTDSRGTARVNHELSAARARTVVITLRGLGVDRDRLSSKGFGESRPAFPNTTAEDRAKNRRVVFAVRD